MCVDVLMCTEHCGPSACEVVSLRFVCALNFAMH